MLDIKWIKENPKEFDRNMLLRRESHKSSELISLYEKWKTEVSKIQSMRQNLKQESAEFQGKVDLQKEQAKENIKNIKLNIKESEQIEKEFKKSLDEALLTVPNVLDSEVPEGDSESDNITIRGFGDKIELQKTHDEILSGSLSWHEANMSGSRFVVSSDKLATLERKLANWMMDFNVKNGYKEFSLPYLVLEKALFNSGQLPKFRDDLFRCDDKFLIPTGEVPLVNLGEGKFFLENELPYKVTSLTPCFRKEAGSAGKDTKGMIRLHQFHKAEIVAFCTEKNSDQIQNEMIANVEKILQKLGLSYRLVAICAGDIGFTASKQYDIEVWFAGAKKYREVSSCSNCKTFQSMRMKCKYIDKETKDKKFVHTLNCSSIAVGRILAALLEQYQEKGNAIEISNYILDKLLHI
ncbi:serine--tRNA ligase [Candidatus Nesciobacter abundans]|uniref:Serine--tRNA ligase n=1 Tax=Candidatus Nesciobacter abundans TaxID=2601668 RepID=A0A5C0UI53_9PROT|nr:serine--tRNA ligase [Candidatus Nesciobacter abundans]QEK39193.1 serine--tRNA ligase [Candidatus Nesciobacter abundans]